MLTPTVIVLGVVRNHLVRGIEKLDLYLGDAHTLNKNWLWQSEGESNFKSLFRLYFVAECSHAPPTC